MDRDPLVTLRGITKRFGAILANDQVDFDLAAGEIHALLGQNGSGKTTLMSVLCGLLAPDAGSIRLHGRPVAWRGPREAIALGIAMIPQQFRLVPTLSVAENVTLGFDPAGRRHARVLADMGRRLRELGARYGLETDPAAVVGSLSMGERQRVEILRALCHDSRVLVMDEPTSVLTPHEVAGLLAMLGRLVQEEGRAVVFVTHKIREALGVARRVTVLRGGRRVATVPAEGLTPEALVEMMMGARAAGAAPPAPRRRPAQAGAGARPVLTVDALTVRPDARGEVTGRGVRDVRLAVGPGEIFGIAGVEGNGQRELELALAGLLRPAGGSVRIRGGGDPAPGGQAVVAYIPSERNRFGLIGDFTVAENLLLREAAASSALLPPPTRRAAPMARAQELVARFRIEPPDTEFRVRQLSGGNAQKVVLARELSRPPAVILAAQPTMGLDVAAAAFVRDQLRGAAAAGAAVLVVSSDLDELLDLCDRIGVMYRGELMGVWDAVDATVAALGAAMAGLRAGPRGHGGDGAAAGGP